MSNTSKLQIKELFIVVGYDKQGNEGVAIGLSETGIAEPLIGGKSRLARIRQLAQVLSDQSGQKLRVVKFSSKDTIEEIVPANQNRKFL